MKILVAMSGGVDSSVAAKLLTDGKNECIGCTMKLYTNDDAGISRAHSCCSLDDVEDARAVAARLGMRYYVFNFADDFRERVIGKFVSSYLSGITPNPCIDCNRYMKFDRLFDRARLLGCEYVATGHYARIDCAGGKYRLRKALDETKDQSYVLYAMTQEQLAHTLFPLGALRKTQTREIAEACGFVNAHKPDSQDICFIPDGDYAKIVERFTGAPCPSGDFISPDGTVLGLHGGIIRYTIGQHRGLGLDLPEKRYVCAICPERNTVTLGSAEDLLSRTACVSECNWISGEAPHSPVRCKVKTRYRQPEQDAAVTPLSDGRARIDFDRPQRAVTPGQAAVFYDGDVVLGGGVIERTPAHKEELP